MEFLYRFSEGSFPIIRLKLVYGSVLPHLSIDPSYNMSSNNLERDVKLN